MSHEAHDGEDDKSREHAGAGIDTADNDGVPAEKKRLTQRGWGWQGGEPGAVVSEAQGEGAEEGAWEQGYRAGAPNPSQGGGGTGRRK